MDQGSGDRQTLSANGQTNAKRYIGPIRLSLSGTFGGGTATLQSKDPAGNWVDIANGAFTAVTDTIFDFPGDVGNTVRVNLTGSTSPALVIWVQGRKGN